MAQREERDESESTDESVEIPVNVVEDSEAEGAEEGEEPPADQDDGHGDAGDEGTESSETADASEVSEVSEAAGQEEEDIFLPPEESEVEVLDAEEGDLDGPVETAEDDERVSELKERVEQLEQTLDEVEQERDEFKDRMMRVAADFENFKKRSKRNEKELRKYGVKGLASDLLPTIDNLERALEHADSSDEGSIIDGVEMVVRQLHTTLEKHGVEVFDATGEQFNPEHHEAIQQVETPDHESGEVLEQFQRGYFLHDRLLRPALVSVAKKVEEEAVEEESAAEDSAADEDSEETAESSD